MPDPACDVLWVRGRLLLSGPQQVGGPSANIGQDVLLLKIEPGAARSILGLPLSELTDRTVPLVDVCRRLAAIIQEHIERDRIADLVGMPTVCADRRFVCASRALSGGVRVRAAAKLVDVGERQLERLFAEHAGLPPVTYSRICRVRRAIAAASSGVPLARAATETGYADQPHFSRDVRALTGRTPRQLLPDVGSVQDLVLGSF